MTSSLPDPRLPSLLGPLSTWLVVRGGVARLSAAAVLAGLCLAAATAPPPALLTAAAAVGWLALVSALVARKRAVAVPVLVLVACVATGAAWGSVRVAALARTDLAPLVGERVVLDLEVTGAAREGGGALKVPVRVRGGPYGTGVEGGGERALLAVRGGKQGLDEGRLLRVDCGVRLPQGPGASGFDEAAYLGRAGIHSILDVDGDEVTLTGRRGGLLGPLDAVRRRARLHLAQGVPPAYAALLRGVILGDTEGIPDETVDAFRRSGTAHILSVSGLHVAGLAGLIGAVFGFARLPRGLATALSLGVVFVFTVVTGAGPAVVRSTVMLTLVLLARIAGRRGDRAQILCVAAAIVLASNPLLLFNAGFQLSFSAVAGLVFLSPWLEGRLIRLLPGPVASGMAVSLAATAATAPVSLLTFGQASLVGVAANLVVVPVVTPVMGLGFASVVVGFASLALCAWLDRLATLLLAFTVTAARLFARGPVVSRAHVAALLAVGLGVGAAVLVARRSATRLRSRRLRRFRSPAWQARAWFAVAVAGALLGLLAYASATSARDAAVAWVGGSRWPTQVEVRMLDVGEGSATLVRTPDRHAVLIDAGPEGRGLLAQLRGLGVRRLDAVVVSHPHADHFEGLEELAGSVPVGVLIDSVAAASVPLTPDAGVGERVPVKEAREYLSIRDALLKDGAAYRRAADGDTLDLGPVRVLLHAPSAPVDPATTEWEGERLNAASIVALVESGGLAILVPGDAEAGVIARYRVSPVDVLFVPHHGSAGAVSERLWGDDPPALACISVGAGNSFGHPSAEALDVLTQAGVPVARTDEVGFVAVSAGDKGNIRVLTGRPEGSGG